MWILIGLTLLTIVFGVISAKNGDDLSFILAGLFGIVLFVAVVSWPISFYGSKAEVERYRALEESLNTSRSGEGSEVERAAVTNEIISYNKDLASVKYWNESIFDIYIYDGLAELPRLK